MKMSNKNDLDKYAEYIRAIYKGNGDNNVSILNPNAGYNYDMIIDEITYTTSIGHLKYTHNFGDENYHDVWFIPHTPNTVQNLTFRDTKALFIDIPENFITYGKQIFVRLNCPIIARGVNLELTSETNALFNGIVYCYESELSKFSRSTNIIGSGFEHRTSLNDTLTLLDLT